MSGARGVSFSMRIRLGSLLAEARKAYHDGGGEGGAWSRSWLKGLSMRNKTLRSYGKRIGWVVTTDPDVSDQFSLWMYLLPRRVLDFVLAVFGCLGLRQADPGWARVVLKILSR